MCGIAGMVVPEGRTVREDILRGMCHCLRHRGPDDEGYHLDGNVGLGIRRLKVVDLHTGHQPIGNENGTIWVTLNGEIYNYRELREQLEKAGHHFATQSDTEVIVHAYEEDGAGCVRRLRGMFAFALWDARTATLLLARDRVGKKPLFYAQVGGGLVFASELQALLRHPALERSIDPSAIDEYLTYGYIPAPRTIFRDVSKLLPGHHLLLTCRDGGFEPHIERYWNLEYVPKMSLSEGNAADGLLKVLREAVRLRMLADVPVGALLSGGIDSSLVVALMSEMAHGPVKTFSVGFEEQDFSELQYARAVAERYCTDHHELVVRPNAADIVSTLVRHYGEPYADWSAIPTYYVSKLTREHVTVALNGDGGDESFAGYQRYLGSVLAHRYAQIPGALRAGAIEPLLSRMPESGPAASRVRQAKGLVQTAGLPPADRHLRWLTYFTEAQKEELYTAYFWARLDGHDARRWIHDRFEDACGRSGEYLDVTLGTDVATYLPNDLLVKMDIASMANSLETRSPFLDHEVMEYSARLPSRYKLRGATRKYLLKRIGRDLLPAHVMHRRKMGFGVPMARWMRGELRWLLDDVLLAPEALERGYFRAAVLRRLVQTHLDKTADHSYQLWSLLWLELWHREFA